jgi:GTPase SAR1 family protein
VVYSITDRQSFQTAVQMVKNIRDNELINNQSPIKRHAPIILVGNKSDLVRKRSVTKDGKLKKPLQKKTIFLLFSCSSCCI